MEHATDPGLLVAVVTSIAAIVVAVITGAFARRSHADDTLRNDLVQARTRADTAENDRRLLMDYALELRAGLTAAGRPVPKWPDGLTR